MSDLSEDWGSEDWGSDYIDEDDDQSSPRYLQRQRSFTILSPDVISERFETVLSDNADLLGISREEVHILMMHFHWKVHKLQDQWLENEMQVRVEAGLSPMSDDIDFSQTRGVKLGGIKLTADVSSDCMICYDRKPNMDALQCKHAYCNDCWRGYINDLLLQKRLVNCRCPTLNCNLKLPLSMIEKHVSPELLSNFERQKLENFIDDSQQFRWCPAPGCNFIAEYPTLGVHEIVCNCSFVFCFSCGEEAHRPASCNIVKTWLLKNSAESENITWIMANTKQCPTCRKPIEKNQGCNHMTCRQEAGGCGYEFCWLCLGPWSEHGTTTGGYYKCNKFEEQIQNKDSSISKEENKRISAKTELDKYIWYFERYNNHGKAQILAIKKQLPEMQEKMKLLHDIKSYPIGELEFLVQAIEQVIRCRRVLKWTYAFGFNLESGPEKNLFEHLQEKLEENTEHLHELCEQPLEPYLDPEVFDKAAFYCYKGNLINYFQVTKQFLDNLLDGIENGLFII